MINIYLVSYNIINKFTEVCIRVLFEGINSIFFIGVRLFMAKNPKLGRGLLLLRKLNINKP